MRFGLAAGVIMWASAAWAGEPVAEQPAEDPAPKDPALPEPPPADAAAPSPVEEPPPAEAPADALAVPAEAPPVEAAVAPLAPRRGRPVPPGTPAAYVDQRPTPPYARWPMPEPVRFADSESCDAFYATAAPGQMGHSIRRFDAVFRRCEATADGYVYRESHAYATLDPVLDPLLLIVPPAVLLSDFLRRGDSVAGADARWDLHGDEPDQRSPTWKGPAVAAPVWKPMSDVLQGAAIVSAFSPAWTSSGNARFTDTLIMAEVHAVSAGIAGSISLRRPEPSPLTDADLRGWEADALWGSLEDLEGDRPFRATVSLHTSSVAASGFGLATLSVLHNRDGSVGAKVLPYAVALGFTALQGTARVMSLREDPGDVLSGALVGTAAGVLVPLSHAAIARVIEPERIRMQQERRRVSVVPTAGPGGVGLVGAW